MNEDNRDNEGPARGSLITDQMMAGISGRSDPFLPCVVISY